MPGLGDLALGLNIVVGYAGLLDLGYVAFWAIGGYIAGWLMSGCFNGDLDHPRAVAAGAATPPRASTSPSGWCCSIAGAVCAPSLGILIGAPTLRLRGDYLALVTLGFGEIIPQFFRNGDDIAGFNLTNGDEGIAPVDPIGTGPFG